MTDGATHLIGIPGHPALTGALVALVVTLRQVAGSHVVFHEVIHVQRLVGPPAESQALVLCRPGAGAQQQEGLHLCSLEDVTVAADVVAIQVYGGQLKAAGIVSDEVQIPDVVVLQVQVDRPR